MVNSSSTTDSSDTSSHTSVDECGQPKPCDVEILNTSKTNFSPQNTMNVSKKRNEKVCTGHDVCGARDKGRRAELEPLSEPTPLRAMVPAPPAGTGVLRAVNMRKMR